MELFSLITVWIFVITIIVSLLLHNKWDKKSKNDSAKRWDEFCDRWFDRYDVRHQVTQQQISRLTARVYELEKFKEINLNTIHDRLDVLGERVIKED